MELFLHAEAVRFRSPDGWYLHASEGEVSATRNRSGHERNVRWSVEVVDADNIRLRSCYGKYLSGLHDVVFLSLPEDLSPSANWELITTNSNDQGVWLMTSGRYLCIDCNRDWDRVTVCLPSAGRSRSVSLNRRDAAIPTLWEVDDVEWMSPYSSDFTRKKLSEILATEERVIFYRIANEFGNVDEGSEESNITFKGSVAHELTQRLEAETGLRDDIILCSLNALNGKLYRLRSLLPPYMNMHVVIVRSSSKFAVESGLLHVEKGREPEVKRSMDEKDSVESGLLQVEKGRDPEVTSSMDKKGFECY